jgi:hypothetical protein
MGLGMTILRPVSRSPEKGAETLVWLATSPDVANVSGVYFLSKRIKPRQVGLRKHNVQVRASLSEDFRAYLDTLEKWFEYLADFRHAVAHRIPLYIPPGGVRSKDVDAYNELEQRMAAALNRFRPDEYERLSAEQSKLLLFQPIVGHSFTEMKSPYYFHPQLISDFLTVEELGDKMLAELARPK